MAIDKDNWHWDSAEEIYRERTGVRGELTEQQKNEIRLYAVDHIGLFLRWIIDNKFETRDENIAVPEDCESVRRGEMSASEYLIKNCNGKFWEDDLCGEIIPFVKKYYDQYLQDYIHNIADGECYKRISGDEEYGKICPIIDREYKIFVTNKK